MNEPNWRGRGEQELLNARLSICYCDLILSIYSSFDMVVRVLATLTSTAAVGGLWLWSTGPGAGVWKVFGALAVILNAIALVVRPGDKIKRFAALRERYIAWRYEVEDFDDFLGTSPTTDEIWKRWTSVKKGKKRVDTESPPAARWLLKMAEAQAREAMGLPPLSAWKSDEATLGARVGISAKARVAPSQPEVQSPEEAEASGREPRSRSTK